MSAEEVTFDTFPKYLLQHAQRRGAQPAVREKSRGIWHTVTWQHLLDEVLALAAALQARGLHRGARVALLSENRPRLQAAMCAVQWLGGVVVPLFQDSTASELAPLIQRAEVTHAFAENQEQVDKLLELMPACPTLGCVVVDNERGMRHYEQAALVTYAALLEQGQTLLGSRREALKAEAASGSGRDVAAIFFTSGTTGDAKAVVLTHAALIDRACAAAAMDTMTDADLALAYLPPAWIGQHLFGYAQPLVVGYCVCCPESSETMLADMREIGATCFLAPPRVLRTLATQVALRMSDAGSLKLGLYDRCMALAKRVGPQILAGEAVSTSDALAYGAANLLIFGPLRDVLGMSRVRVAYTSGEAVGADMLGFFRSIGINLKQLYGSTETGFFVAMQRDGAFANDAIGPAAQGVELKLSPAGEILVRTPGMFTEYHRDSAATNAVKSVDGWFHTGDVGHLSDNGHLRVVGRMQDIGSLRNGTKLVPKLLENRLKASPYIKEAVASGHGRDAVCMLVNIDMAAVGNWADRRSISYTGYADLASRDEVHQLVGEVINRVNAELAQDAALAGSQTERYAILTKELDADDGVLTRLGKLRRAVIAERYRVLIDAMHDGLDSVRFSAEVRYDDGRADSVSEQVRIRRATAHAVSASRKAA
jgi:long-chain acyl-CoA synthetase